MDTKRTKRPVFVIMMLVALSLVGCGTLKIDIEPTADLIEPNGAVEEAAREASGQVTEKTTRMPVEEELGNSELEVAENEVEGADTEVEIVETGQNGDLLTYRNLEYGFELTHPPTWSVAEVNDDDFLGPGSRSVQLSQETVILVIGYRRVGETSQVGGGGAPAGDIEDRGTVIIFGVSRPKQVVVFDGKDKVVFYGGIGAPLQTGNLEFSLRMDDFKQVDYSVIDLDERVQDEADMILSSLALVGDNVGDEAAVIQLDYTGWKSYTNESLGYSLMHPGDTDVMGGDLDQAVEFVGPVVGNDHWPWFSVQHFDSPFFRPAAGTDVRQWIAESNIPYDPEEQNLLIGGLPAVHFTVEASPQAYGRDAYYLIHGQQLILITILHTDGRQDQTLYDQFLQSITFRPA